MLVKLGVDISRLKREIRRKLNQVELILGDRFKSEAVLTSTYDGTHSTGSLHYSNDAVDVRIPRAPMEEVVQAVEDLKRILGKDYDVLLESDHIHVEFDPKG